MRILKKKVSKKEYEKLQREEYAAKHLARTLAAVNNTNEGKLKAAEKYIGFLAVKGEVSEILPEEFKEFCTRMDVNYYLSEDGIVHIEVTEKAEK